jgi:drug/metabolite transporter (DMT)-like permease
MPIQTLLSRLTLSLNAYIGVVLALLAAISFSTKAVLVKLVYQYHVDVYTALMLRMIFALPFFMVIAWVNRSEEKAQDLNTKDYLLLVAMGLLGYYLSSLFDFIGLKYISTGLERLIVFIYPTMVVLIGAVIFNKKILKNELWSLGLTYIGVLFVFYHDIWSKSKPNGVLGASFVLMSTITYAMYLVGSEKLIARFGVKRFTCYAMMVSSIAVIFHCIIVNGIHALKLPWEVYGLSILMALLSTVLASMLLSQSIKMIGAGKTSIIGSIGPISTITLAYFFLGESITYFEILGTMLVLLGVFMVSINSKKGGK